MSLKTNFQRKMFWISDFLRGSQMWKQYKEIGYLAENQGGGEI